MNERECSQATSYCTPPFETDDKMKKRTIQKRREEETGEKGKRQTCSVLSHGLTPVFCRIHRSLQLYCAAVALGRGLGCAWQQMNRTQTGRGGGYNGGLVVSQPIPSIGLGLHPVPPWSTQSMSCSSSWRERRDREEAEGGVDSPQALSETITGQRELNPESFTKALCTCTADQGHILHINTAHYGLMSSSNTTRNGYCCSKNIKKGR